MGGDVYKSVSLGSGIKDQSTALFSVFMDRFGGLIILLLFALFGISSLYGGFGVLASIVILIIGLVLYFPVLKIASKKVKFLKKFETASFLFVKNKKLGGLVLFYSLLVQLLSFFQIYLLFLGVNITLSIKDLLAFGPIVSLSSLIPSFNGFGTQETVYAYVFQNAGVTLALSITVSIMFHAMRLIMSLIGGLLILTGIGPKKDSPEI